MFEAENIRDWRNHDVIDYLLVIGVAVFLLAFIVPGVRMRRGRRLVR